MNDDERDRRLCNGGPHGQWCGAVATVVVTEKIADPLPALQWYACDDVAHHEGGSTEPIAQWFVRVRSARR